VSDREIAAELTRLGQDLTVPERVTPDDEAVVTGHAVPVETVPVSGVDTDRVQVDLVGLVNPREVGMVGRGPRFLHRAEQVGVGEVAGSVVDAVTDVPVRERDGQGGAGHGTRVPQSMSAKVESQVTR